jgi:hypothetical protein
MSPVPTQAVYGQLWGGRPQWQGGATGAELHLKILQWRERWPVQTWAVWVCMPIGNVSIPQGPDGGGFPLWHFSVFISPSLLPLGTTLSSLQKTLDLPWRIWSDVDWRVQDMNITMFLTQPCPWKFSVTAILSNPGLGSVHTGIFWNQYRHSRWASSSLGCFQEQADQRQHQASDSCVTVNY